MITDNLTHYYDFLFVSVKEAYRHKTVNGEAQNDSHPQKREIPRLQQLYSVLNNYIAFRTFFIFNIQAALSPRGAEQ